ncbi:MAG: M20/M25/M40 family metallo-hydrolase [Deltaproteobacteria bacterium]|nr:M20/M25/M40 family metallo-hydrolase [Deltaproteobacteria bacterium]
MPQNNDREVVGILSELIKINTSNPPGDEIEAIEYCARYIKGCGIEPRVIESSHKRGNLVARIKGSGRTPFLLTGHIDTVPADESGWKYPPFSGAEEEGFVWGRGALDMKHFVAMSLVVLKELISEGFKPKRDIILAVTCDEEEGSQAGAKYLVEKHPDLIDAEFGLGEVGGFSMNIGGKRLYPVMTSEKGFAWLKITAEGESGHGSMPVFRNSVGRLGLAAWRLSNIPLPLHITKDASDFLKTVGNLAGLKGKLLRLLMYNLTNEIVNDNLITNPNQKKYFRSLLRNTASPSIFHGGEKVNVIPKTCFLKVDLRYLPGISLEEAVDEVREVAGDDVKIEVESYGEPVQFESKTELFAVIRNVIEKEDSGAVVTPYMSPGFTDAKYFSKRKITVYGFTPLRFGGDFSYTSLIHSENERVPVDALIWGKNILKQIVKEYCG